MRLSAVAACSLARTTGALFRVSGSSRRRFQLSPTTAKLPSHLGLHRLLRPAASSPRRMASAPVNASVTTNPSSTETWDDTDPVSFGPHPIPRSTIFATSPLSFAFVNLRPVVPGHVLVSSKRVAPRFADLTAEEASDLWLLAQRVGNVVERKAASEASLASTPPPPTTTATLTTPSPPSPSSASASSALTFALQDGAAAGQSVPHVHVHVIPRGGPADRFAGEERNDDLYPVLRRAGAALSRDRQRAARGEVESGVGSRTAASGGAPDPFQRERRDRALQEMEAEAAALRELFA